MPLRSSWFSGNERCQQCAVIDAKHILLGDSGLHVFLIQKALTLLHGSVIEPTELDQWRYGASTSAAVLRYKEARTIINRTYQQKADDIVGKMTMASLDEGMHAFESGLLLLGGAGLMFGRILLAAPRVIKTSGPRMVVISETAQPWSKWADQFVAAEPKARVKVPIPAGQSPANIARVYKHAIALAGAGGTVIISVGHGIPSDVSKDDGMFDLGPLGSFKIGGRNALLVGDQPPSDTPKNKLVFHHTQVFYADSPPKPYRSRKADDEDSKSTTAQTRLNNWKAYEDISAAFKAQRLYSVIMLTCRIGGASGMIRKVAQQWGTPITGYKRRIVGQEQANKRVRVFLQGDPEGSYYQWPNTSNTPASETFFPFSRDMVVLHP
ncbi:hypothetical protein [Thiocystis violacea]|uniref:hypothetical protein n=1 Tax=Thiocystis violacea TaxID=13725 RepID=UPI0019037DD4|nr:hypothetical protein [Thiocystis violacea]MBK1717185.1 hypothetical protein [Thiocystis violacea]